RFRRPARARCPAAVPRGGVAAAAGEREEAAGERRAPARGPATRVGLPRAVVQRPPPVWSMTPRGGEKHAIPSVRARALPPLARPVPSARDPTVPLLSPAFRAVIRRPGCRVLGRRR